MSLRHQHLAECLAQGDLVAGESISRLQALGLAPQQALAYINRLIDQQTFTRATDDIFLASAGAFLLLIGGLWLTKRPPRLGAAGPVDAGGAH